MIYEGTTTVALARLIHVSHVDVVQSPTIYYNRHNVLPICSFRSRYNVLLMFLYIEYVNLSKSQFECFLFSHNVKYL